MTSSAFSTPETTALERQAEIEVSNVQLSEIWSEKHKKVCIGWIKQNNYKIICLQFPDDYLTHSTQISDNLKEACPDVKLFILADTSYGSCCVDEIAASHVDADSLIHFGNACRSKVSRLPVLYMFPDLPFELDHFMAQLKDLSAKSPNEKYSIYLDIGYHYVLDEDDDYFYGRIKESFNNEIVHIEKYPFDDDHKNYVSDDTKQAIAIFVGEDTEKFFNLTATTEASKWFVYDPKLKTLAEKNPLVANWIRRRYYYIEKCKDAKVLGLIVATLTAEGYLDVVDHIQAMARSRGIKTKIISVGRINPAKLANFLDIDCFVLIGCPFNNLYNSREFFKPVVSVFEAEIAFNPAWHMKYPETYVTDFREILPYGKYFFEFKASDVKDLNDVSLISGKMRNIDEETGETSSPTSGSGELAETKNLFLMDLNSGVSFHNRSWQGLDPALGCTEPARVEKGLSGIPIKYTHD